jgi:hypothetical protein
MHQTAKITSWFYWPVFIDKEGILITNLRKQIHIVTSLMHCSTIMQPLGLLDFNEP